MDKKEKFIEFLNLIDDELGIGLGIDYDDISEEIIDKLKDDFIKKFTVVYNFSEILNSLNESSGKSYMEMLDEI